jgi:hypothetical protein
MKLKYPEKRLGMTLASLLFSFAVTPAAADDPALASKIRKTVARLVKSNPKIENLSCSQLVPAGRAPQPARRHILTFKRDEDDRPHQIETEVAGQKITQVRSLTLVGKEDRRIVFENQVWRSLEPAETTFNADLIGREAFLDFVKETQTRNPEAKTIENLAPMVKRCCESVTCASQLVSPIVIGHTDKRAAPGPFD